MAITNVFSITYGSLTVGGSSSTMQLSGPYVIDRSHSRLRLVFDVVVVATSYDLLQSLSESLEAAMSSRDQSVEIDISGNLWTYTAGTTILNTVSSCQKSGNRETDRGYARAYTCIIEGDLPSSDQAGLRELEVHTAHSPSRQMTVTMRGVYTADDGDTATDTYGAAFDARAAAILTSIDNTATWELVTEEQSRDRNDSLLQFTRQYLQLLANQSDGSLDDTEIRDHRVSFTDLSQHPGDSAEGVHRLRRVSASYDCAVDADETTDLHDVFESKVMPHLLSVFVANFSPRVYGVEEKRVGYDETGNRISAAVTLIYQKAGGQEIVELAESTTTRETRNVDYTPIHDGGELSAYADTGWMVKERILSRTAMVIGDEQPAERLTKKSGQPSALGGLGDAVESGWTTIQSTSQVTAQWIGDPEYGQIRVSIISENVVKRYHEEPRR